MQQIVEPRKYRTIQQDIPAYVPFHTLVDSASCDTISKSKSSTTNSTNSSSDDETYVSAASSETNLTSDAGGIASASSCAGGIGGGVGGSVGGIESHGLLLTRQALHTYQSNNHLVQYKYAHYGRSYAELPK